MKSALVRLYRVRVDYSIDVDASIEESIESRVLAFKHVGLDVVCWHGGPCWNPYIIVEGEDANDVREFVEKVERYIDSRKGAEVVQ